MREVLNLINEIAKPLVRGFCDWRIRVARAKMERRIEEIRSVDRDHHS
jgi:hypothetical protein